MLVVAIDALPLFAGHNPRLWTSAGVTVRVDAAA
jgi:hypothetical protein